MTRSPEPPAFRLRAPSYQPTTETMTLVSSGYQASFGDYRDDSKPTVPKDGCSNPLNPTGERDRERERERERVCVCSPWGYRRRRGGKPLTARPTLIRGRFEFAGSDMASKQYGGGQRHGPLRLGEGLWPKGCVRVPYPPVEEEEEKIESKVEVGIPN